MLRARRAEINAGARLLQRLIGLEAKLAQYEQGEQFIAAVEEVGGPTLLNRAFERPENLPTMDEIRDPRLWLARVGRSSPRREPVTAAPAVPDPPTPSSPRCSTRCRSRRRARRWTARCRAALTPPRSWPWPWPRGWR